MEKYSSTRALESRTHPGVTYSLKKMSEKRYAELQRVLAPTKAKARELAQGFRALMDKRVPVFDEDGKPKMNVLTAEQEHEFKNPADQIQANYLIEDINDYARMEINPLWIRWGLASIDGLEIDGEPATVDSLLGAGPDDLVAEILAAVQGRAELTPEQEKKLESRITLNGVVHDTTTTTSAKPVNGALPSSQEIAPSTIPVS